VSEVDLSPPLSWWGQKHHGYPQEPLPLLRPCSTLSLPRLDGTSLWTNRKETTLLSSAGVSSHFIIFQHGLQRSFFWTGTALHPTVAPPSRCPTASPRACAWSVLLWWRQELECFFWKQWRRLISSTCLNKVAQYHHKACKLYGKHDCADPSNCNFPATLH